MQNDKKKNYIQKNCPRVMAKAVFEKTSVFGQTQIQNQKVIIKTCLYPDQLTV